MTTAGRVYVLSAAVALVAMASRVGWIDWPLVGHVAEVGLTALAVIIAILGLIAVLLGLPALLVMAVTEGLAGPVPDGQAGDPPA